MINRNQVKTRAQTPARTANDNENKAAHEQLELSRDTIERQRGSRHSLSSPDSTSAHTPVLVGVVVRGVSWEGDDGRMMRRAGTGQALVRVGGGMRVGGGVGMWDGGEQGSGMGSW